MYAVVVTFRIAADKIESFRERVIEQAKRSVQSEDGCLRFDVCESEEEPVTFLLYELYADHRAFDAHLASTHFRRFDAEVAPWVEDKQVATWLRISE